MRDPASLFAQVIHRSQLSMHAEKLSLDEAIAKALLRTHLSDRVEIVVESMRDHSSARPYSKEQLDDIAVYAFLEADKQGRSFDADLIRRLIDRFLNELDGC